MTQDTEDIEKHIEADFASGGHSHDLSEPDQAWVLGLAPFSSSALLGGLARLASSPRSSLCARELPEGDVVGVPVSCLSFPIHE